VKQIRASFKRIEGAQAGILIDQMNPNDVYLAIPDDGTSNCRESFWYRLHPGWQYVFDLDENGYMVTLWTREVDQKIMTLIDGLIYLRRSHPTVVQLKMFDPEGNFGPEVSQ
jgi:hypothetical protein